ncbi:MAG: chemotaxis protein CheW [Caulobacteraceae bacterium]
MSLGDYVTLRVGGHLFGIDAAQVQDVFYPRGLTPVPTAKSEVEGLLNLRGRIVTAVCARSRLQLPPRPPGSPEPKAIGVEINGDSYGLIVDDVEEVVRINSDELLSPPGSMPARWAELIKSIWRMDKEILVVLDVRRLLARAPLAAA